MKKDVELTTKMSSLIDMMLNEYKPEDVDVGRVEIGKNSRVKMFPKSMDVRQVFEVEEWKSPLRLYVFVWVSVTRFIVSNLHHFLAYQALIKIDWCLFLVRHRHPQQKKMYGTLVFFLLIMKLMQHCVNKI